MVNTFVSRANILKVFKRFITNYYKKAQNDPRNAKIEQISKEISKWTKMLDKLKSSERKVPGKKKQLEEMLEELRTKFDIECKRFKAKYIIIEHISSSTLSYFVYNLRKIFWHLRLPI